MGYCIYRSWASVHLAWVSNLYATFLQGVLAEVHPVLGLEGVIFNDVGGLRISSYHLVDHPTVKTERQHHAVFRSRSNPSTVASLFVNLPIYSSQVTPLFWTPN